MHARLAQRAPQAAEKVPPADRSRVIRLLELLEMGALEDEEPQVESQLWTEDTRHPTLLVALTIERAALYARIDARVSAMVAAGAADEVRRADAAGASATARKALGFDELLRGDVEAMKRRTRNYARRQLTWMRRLEGVQILDASAFSPDQLAGQLIFPRP
jgi:tRNA dimethylallyltransferase